MGNGTGAARRPRSGRAAEAALGRLAQRRGGVFSPADAVTAGIADSDIAYRIQEGTWVRQFGVGLRAATTPVTRRVREEAALMRLGNGAVLSHFSAAAHWRLDVPEHSDVWISVPHELAPRRVRGIRVVRSRVPFGRSAMLVNGLPVLDPARTIADLAMVLDVRALTAITLQAMQRELCRLEELAHWHRLLKGRPGGADLGLVVEEADPAFESVLSAEFGTLVSGAGIHLTPRHAVRLPNGTRAICDFADEQRRIDFEADGLAYHSSPAQLARDRERDRQLLRVGWVTVRYSTDEIRRHPADTMADVRAQLAARTPRQ